MELKITDLSKKFGDFTAVDNLNVTMTMKRQRGIRASMFFSKKKLWRLIYRIVRKQSGYQD